MPDYTLVICSRNRCAQLARMLNTLDQDALSRLNFELILVNSASEDATHSTMSEFCRQAKFPVQIETVGRAGLGLARNIGVQAACGDKLLFTDDDCYFEPGFFDKFCTTFDEKKFQYGGGDVYLYDNEDDPIGTFRRPTDILIPPETILPTGAIQGANMFFSRDLLHRLGGFRVDFGAGTMFPAEDIELCTRASFAGYIGAIRPELIVYHHHGRKRGSREALKVRESYDYGRGAYYASLMMTGIRAVWGEWENSVHGMQSGSLEPETLRRVERELRGAAAFVASQLERDEPRF